MMTSVADPPLEERAPCRALLEVHDISVAFGPIAAVRGLALHVERGEIVALLGPNGAGKSTTLKALMHLVDFEGDVFFDGESLRGRSTEEIVRMGMTLAPEGRQVFAALTVEENLSLGGATRGRNGRATMEELLELFPVLRERRRQLAGTLSGGEQQQLAIARALMSQPRLLLLDEPSLGLVPRIVKRIFELLVELRERGVTLLVVEQNVRKALEIADRGYVLASGEIRLSASAEQLHRGGEIERAYLGLAVA